MVDEKRPILPEIFGQADPVASKSFKNGNFQSIFALSGSALTPSEKVQS